MWQLNERRNNFVYHRATQRLKRYRAVEKLDDFFAALIEDKNSLKCGEIVTGVFIMSKCFPNTVDRDSVIKRTVNAGSDTTAKARNNAMYFLPKNPQCLIELREEIDSVLDDTEVVASYEN